MYGTLKWVAFQPMSAEEGEPVFVMQVHVAPLVLEIDQQHITEILAAVDEALQPFQSPQATEER